MHKILIVGHPQSGYAHVEALLRAAGMEPAQPTRRDGFTAVQIGSTIRQALGRTPPAPGTPWQWLAIDLMIANADQPLWGWSDPQALAMLDYWLDADPHLRVVMVYAAPGSVLSELSLQAAATLEPSGLDARLADWQAYNAALLRHALRHPQRCMLVNGRQAQAAPDELLQCVGRRIDSAWKPPAARRAAGDAGDRLCAWLLDGLLDGHHASQTLYDELQCASELADPGAQPVQRRRPLAAWREWASLKLDLQKQAGLALEARQEAQDQARRIEALSRKLDDVRHQAELAARQREAEHASQLEGLQAHRAEEERRTHQRRQADRQAHDLLVDQLLKVQAALEVAHQQGLQAAATHGEQLEALKTELARQHEAASAAARQHDAATHGEQLEALKTELARQREAASASARQHDAAVQAERARAAACGMLQRERDQLLDQLHRVQEALERQTLDSQRLQARLDRLMHPPAPTGAADRVKAHLSYRLGATMIRHSRSATGWLTMLPALWRVRQQFRADRQARDARRMPPIHRYQDAHEAERVKQHLSYRLGQTLLGHAATPVGWLMLPFALQREVRDFRQQRQAS